ncbi:MAG: hypothetical protein AAFX87_18090 [Bacteroidota bacterium]
MSAIDENIQASIEEIMTSGYEYAANAFSGITRQQVEVNGYASMSLECNITDQTNRHVNELTVVRTDIVGELAGSGYLVFNKAEFESIADMGLAVLGGSASIDKPTVMKEIDNIISASVITELSEGLDIDVYGAVPQLFQLEHLDQLNERTLTSQTKDDCYLLFYNRFVFEGFMALSPLFIWEIDRKIIDLVGVQTT